MTEEKKSNPNGYKLSRDWFEFVLDNPDKVSGNHTALYFWIVEINNRCGWREKFSITVKECMDGMSCKHRNTYSKCFKDLIEWGFITVVVPAVNQYQCNVIALTKNVQACKQASDRHVSKQVTGTDTSNNAGTDTILKHLNHQNDKNLKPETISGKKVFSAPDSIDVLSFLMRKNEKNEEKLSSEVLKRESEKFVDFYSSKNWLVGKNKMVSWESAASGWLNRCIEKEKEKKLINAPKKTRIIGNQIDGRDDFGEL